MKTWIKKLLIFLGAFVALYSMDWIGVPWVIILLVYAGAIIIGWYIWQAKKEAK